MSDYKDIVIDNDAIVNTEPRALETEPHNIPLGEKPTLNPNPGKGASINQKLVEAFKKVQKIYEQDTEGNLNHIKFYAKIKTVAANLVKEGAEYIEGTFSPDDFGDTFTKSFTFDQFNELDLYITYEKNQYQEIGVYAYDFDTFYKAEVVEFKLIEKETDDVYVPILKNVGRYTEPAIKTELKEGERGTPVEVVTPAEEGFKCVRDIYNFLNGIRIKGKTIEEYVDYEGGVTQQELVAALVPYAKKTDLNGKANVWRNDYIGNENIWTNEIKVGDIIVDSSGPFVGIVTEIEFEVETQALYSVIITGLEGAANPTRYFFESGAWSSQDYDGGIKLYVHEIIIVGTVAGTGICRASPFNVISTRKTPYVLSEDGDLLVGYSILSLTDDNPVVGSRLSISSQNVQIIDAVNNSVNITSITDFIDTVTEL